MTLKDSIQTAFLVVGIFTILVFGASYYFMFLDADPTKQPLKDSLTITASFFGGFATLTAAYIASRLFNDWREQHDKQIDNKFMMDVINAFEVFDGDAALITLMFTNFEIKLNNNTLSDHEITNINEHLNPIIEKIIHLVMPLSKLRAYFEYYEIVNNKTKSDEFEEVYFEIRFAIHNLNTLDNTFQFRFEHLKDKLIPMLGEKILFLEDKYINPLRVSLKATNQ